MKNLTVITLSFLFCFIHPYLPGAEARDVELHDDISQKVIEAVSCLKDECASDADRISVADLVNAVENVQERDVDADERAEKVKVVVRVPEEQKDENELDSKKEQLEKRLEKSLERKRCSQESLDEKSRKSKEVKVIVELPRESKDQRKSRKQLAEMERLIDASEEKCESRCRKSSKDKDSDSLDRIRDCSAKRQNSVQVIARVEQVTQSSIDVVHGKRSDSSRKSCERRRSESKDSKKQKDKKKGKKQQKSQKRERK